MALRFRFMHGLANLFFLALGIVDPAPIVGMVRDFQPPYLLAFTPVVLFPFARLLIIHDFSIREKSGEVIAIKPRTRKDFFAGFWIAGVARSKFGAIAFYGISYATGALLSRGIMAASVSFAGLFVLVISATLLAAEISACKQWNAGKRSPVL